MVDRLSSSLRMTVTVEIAMEVTGPYRELGTARVVIPNDGLVDLGALAERLAEALIVTRDQKAGRS